MTGQNAHFTKTPVEQPFSLGSVLQYLAQQAASLGDEVLRRTLPSPAKPKAGQPVLVRSVQSRPPYNPKFRAYGKARLDIARRLKTQEDWETLWKPSLHPFAFQWGDYWKQCIEYNVAEYAAEVGFFIDVLGFPINAIGPEYAMFTSPDEDFFFSVIPTPPGEQSTPPDAIRLQFMVANILETARELERRGVIFEARPEPVETNSQMYSGYFRTPNGIGIDLWGKVVSTRERPSPQTRMRFQQKTSPEEASEDEE